MYRSDARPWPDLPKECLDSIVQWGGPQAAASLSSICRSWRSDLADDILWRSWHDCLPLLRYHTWRSSYCVYAGAMRRWLGGLETRGTAVPTSHERWITSLDLSPTHVLSGSLDTNVKYWDRRRPGAWVHYLRGHTGLVSSVRLAYDGLGSGATACTRAFSGARDGTLRCWDLVTGTCVRAYTMEGGRQWVNAVAVWRPRPLEPKRQHWPSGGAAAGGSHSTASCFGAQGGGRFGVLGAGAAASAPSAATVVCGTSNGNLWLYDVRQAGPAQRIMDLARDMLGQGAVYSVSVYGDAVAAACANGYVHIFDLRSGSVRHTLKEHRSACTCVDMYGPTLVAGDLEGNVYLWSTQETGPWFRGAFSPAAGAAASRGTDTAAPATAPVDAAASTADAPTGTAAPRMPPGTGWPKWKPPGRRYSMFAPRFGVGSDDDDDVSECSSDNYGSSSDDNSGGRTGPRRCRWSGFSDSAAVVAALEGLAEGKLTTALGQPLRLPGQSSWASSPAGLAAAVAGGTAGIEGAGAVVAAAAEAAAAAVGQPQLRALMQQGDWIRDVALVGPWLALSASKEGRVCLTRTDTMQVVAVWDIAATGAVAAASAGAGHSALRSVFMGNSGSESASPGGSRGPITANSQVDNQAHALAADEWGFVAGCQDASLRMWSFAPSGELPELWTASLLSDMRALKV